MPARRSFIQANDEAQVRCASEGVAILMQLQSAPVVAALLGGRALLLEASNFSDQRGQLTAFEFADLFAPLRAFLVHDVPDGSVRGGHAHRCARQLLVCLSGRVAVDLSLGGKVTSVVLDGPGQMLLVEPQVWSQQRYENGAKLLVFASERYDPASYIHADSPT